MQSSSIISWNVNGIRAQIKKGFVDIVRTLDVDYFCIQETKAQDDQVLEALEALRSDYFVYSNSAERKGYSGTCIISKHEVPSLPDIGVPEHDTEGRVLRVDAGAFNLVNVYVPNSGNGLSRLGYRETFDEAFNEYLYELSQDKPLIVTGDFNVAPTALDLARPDENFNKTAGFTQIEIDGVEALYRIGMFDAWRTLHPDAIQYTFWNQRIRAREKNIGWRIDYFLLTNNLLDHLKSAEILDQIMGSDHCPIRIDLSL